jgi:hypothetical protein
MLHQPLINDDGTFNRAAIYAKVQLEFNRGLGWDIARCRRYAWRIARTQRAQFEAWEDRPAHDAAHRAMCNGW